MAWSVSDARRLKEPFDFSLGAGERKRILFGMENDMNAVVVSEADVHVLRPGDLLEVLATADSGQPSRLMLSVDDNTTLQIVPANPDAAPAHRSPSVPVIETPP